MPCHSTDPIDPIDHALFTAIDATIDNKTKPRGSLGELETLARQICRIQRTCRPAIEAPTILVFAADHGVVAENISAYPQSVTWQMVENFLAGGAAINVFARQSNCALRVVDAGVNHVFGVRDGLLDRKIAFGTQNFATQSAMSPEQCNQAMQYGADLIVHCEGNLVGFGEMGIGNTTSAAAILHKLTGLEIARCVGAGTGLSAAGVLHKQRVIAAAVARHAGVETPLEVLATFGGFETAMMVGAMLAAVERKMILLIDGFIVSSAVLVAARLLPDLLDYCVFSHCSDESGHRPMLEFLGVRGLLNLGLRLGEGSGCALALPLLQAAVNFVCEMATFESAQVSEKSE